MKAILDNRGARAGLFFGATSGVITTIGLIVGLSAGTHSKVAVLGGILVIAVADAMSDALGMHLAEESHADTSRQQIWAATISTFLTKFFVSATFAIPFLFLSLQQALWLCLAWGFTVIAFLSYMLARYQRSKPLPAIAEHLLIAIAVVIISHFIGVWVQDSFA